MNKTSVSGDAFCIETTPEACVTVIFGATGNLTVKKLLPAFAKLKKANLLHRDSKIVLVSRKNITKEEYFKSIFPAGALEEISSTAIFDPDRKDAGNLKKTLDSISLSRVFYFALPPGTYIKYAAALAEAELLDKNCRVIIEKPPGYDERATVELQNLLKRHLSEQQIYLIDHYLGKDEVLNIIMLRFANTVFSGIWNSNFIRNITIAVSEKEGISGRSAYFDKAGIIRDMFQSHLLFMLALCITDKIAPFDRLHFDRALRKALDTVYFERLLFAGQYESYRSVPGVKPFSNTLTCADMIFRSRSRKWKDTSFRLLAGKSLASDRTVIKIFFKPANCIFPAGTHPLTIAGNILELELKPAPGISLTLAAKKEGPHLCTGTLQLSTGTSNFSPSDAYARLLLDCQNKDRTLFAGFATFARTGSICDELIDKISANSIRIYPDGTLDFFS